jgi:hypothetical protein
MGAEEGGVVCWCSCRTEGEFESRWTLHVENAASCEIVMDDGDDADRVEGRACIKARRTVEEPTRIIVAMTC